jgi:hypothetical protein
MRNGNCAIELQFEKEGKPLAGAHVLIKRRPEPTGFRTTGIRVDTLLHATQPLETRPYDAFGYRAPDRPLTRYAVSDASGAVRIDRLPTIPIVVEVLIPTANFAGAGKNWDLLMEVAPGDVRPTWLQPSGRRGGRAPEPAAGRAGISQLPPSVSRQDGPAIAQLKEGETVKYPKFIVRPQLSLNLAEWSPVDVNNLNNFVLEWTSLAGDLNFDHYEVEMVLAAPQQGGRYEFSERAIWQTIEETLDARWPVGQAGVGGQRLSPGNVYTFEIRAVDRNKKVIARLPRTHVWTRWAHRPSSPPIHESSGPNSVPIFDGATPRSGTQIAGQPRVDIRETVAKFLAQPGDQFEREYVQLGRAWLRCLDGQLESGRAELDLLVQTLPEGNIVRGTARSLLTKLATGQPLPQRLEFVADE